MDKKKKKSLFIAVGVLILLLGGIIYYMNINKFENYEKLAKDLPAKHMEAIAQITRIDKKQSVVIRGKTYTNGYFYTYVFSAKRKKYMGNDFLKTVKYQINDTATVIYLPKNPSVNEFKVK